MSTPTEDFYATLQGNYSQCDDIKVRQFLFDIEATKICPVTSSNEEVVSTFVAVKHGFVHVSPTNDTSFFDKHLNSWRQPYFLRTWDTSKWIITSIGKQKWQNNTVPVVMATKAVSGAVAGRQFKSAVVGVQLTQGPLETIIRDVVTQCSDESINCYLVDDGAIIVYTDFNNDRNVGKFLGDVEPALMTDLIDESVFIYHTEYNFQGTCYPPTNGVTSDGHRLFPPLFYELLSFNWWTASTWAFANFLNFYSWMFSMPSTVEGEEVTMASEGYDCIQMLHKYHFGENSDFSGRISCSKDCLRSYAVTRLQESNLMLIMMDSANTENCQTTCQEMPTLPFQPVETEDPFFAGDQCRTEPRYRKRPPCREENPYESESHCGACCQHASLQLMCAVILAAMLLYRQLSS